MTLWILQKDCNIELVVVDSMIFVFTQTRIMVVQ